MKLNYFLISEAASRTDEGRHVLHGIFDRVLVKKAGDVQDKDKPKSTVASLPKFALAYEVSDIDSVKSHKVDIRLKQGEDEILKISSTTPEVKEKTPLNKIGGIAQIVGLSFAKFGEYSFDLEVDDKLIGQSKLSVSEIE